MELGALRFDWGEVYEVGVGPGGYWARRHDGPGQAMMHEDPGELRRQIREDYSERPRQALAFPSRCSLRGTGIGVGGPASRGAPAGVPAATGHKQPGRRADDGENGQQGERPFVGVHAGDTADGPRRQQRVLRARPATARAITRFSGAAMIVVGILLLAERLLA
jgi:hypothetical protein